MKPRLLFLGAMLILGGCTTALLPLCPDVAEDSVDPQVSRDFVNPYVRQAIEERGIVIVELSPFVAEFSGPSFQMRWLQDRYPHLVCAFDPRKEILNREVFMTCVSKAPEWIKAVQSDRPQDLMLRQTLYRETCVSERE